MSIANELMTSLEKGNCNLREVQSEGEACLLISQQHESELKNMKLMLSCTMKQLVTSDKENMKSLNEDVLKTKMYMKKMKQEIRQSITNVQDTKSKLETAIEMSFSLISNSRPRKSKGSKIISKIEKIKSNIRYLNVVIKAQKSWIENKQKKIQDMHVLAQSYRKLLMK